MWTSTTRRLCPSPPLLFGQREAEIIADVARRAILASKLLGPLLAQLPESSRTWFDARKIVDRLDFDGRELLGYVRRINPDRVSEIFAEVQLAIQCPGSRSELQTSLAELRRRLTTLLATQ